MFCLSLQIEFAWNFLVRCNAGAINMCDGPAVTVEKFLAVPPEQRQDDYGRQDCDANSNESGNPGSFGIGPVAVRCQRLLGTLCEHEVHVDEHGDEHQRRQRPESKAVGIFAAKDQSADDEKDESCGGTSEHGCDEPRQHDGNNTLVGWKVGTTGIFLSPHDSILSIPHQSETYDGTDCNSQQTIL